MQNLGQRVIIAESLKRTVLGSVAQNVYVIK